MVNKVEIFFIAILVLASFFPATILHELTHVIMIEAYESKPISMCINFNSPSLGYTTWENEEGDYSSLSGIQKEFLPYSVTSFTMLGMVWLGLKYKNKIIKKD